MTFKDRDRTLDPLRIVAALIALVMAVIVVIVALKPGVVVEPPPVKRGDDGTTAPSTAVPTPPPPPPDPLLTKKLEDATATTKKAKLLKEELKKRAAEREKERLRKLAMATPPPVAIGVMLSGEGSLRSALARKLKGTTIVDSAVSGWLLSVRADRGANKDGTVYCRCSVAISEMPGKRLVGALSSQADVGGRGVSVAELEKDATDACIASLAEDVTSWLRAHR